MIDRRVAGGKCNDRNLPTVWAKKWSGPETILVLYSLHNAHS